MHYPRMSGETKSQPVLRSSFAVSAMHHKMAGLPGALILGYRNPYRNSRTNPIRKFTNSSCQRINVLGQENTKCWWMLTMKPRNMLGSDQQKCPQKKPWSIRDSGDFPHDHCIKMVGSGVTSSNKQDQSSGDCSELGPAGNRSPKVQVTTARCPCDMIHSMVSVPERSQHIYCWNMLKLVQATTP